ncbi:MAG: VIT1/CCC1 transporter family protein [Deltaproteobacteria bacterium]|nr:VIT1/CCC1 transporter family protein [Deltaproteobacteria bacterium]
MTEPRNDPLVLKVARDEAFDMALYVRLREMETGEVHNVLSRLVTVERGHVAFWADFAGLDDSSLDRVQRLRLSLLVLLRRCFGVAMTFLILEAIEIYGVKKYWALWDRYKDTPYGPRIRGILRDEFGHEDEIVAGLTGRRLNPERVRDLFLGLNDGLVEVLGSVAGFYASFGHPAYVAVASLTVAVAGSISMAAGVLASSRSQREVQRIENAKRNFFDPEMKPPEETRPLSAAVSVGISYFVGAMFPIFPVLLGAVSPLWSIAVGVAMVVLVTAFLSVMSGMEVRPRVLQNLLLVFGAVGVTYVLGTLVKQFWNISV